MCRSLRYSFLVACSLLLILWLAGCTETTEPSTSGPDVSETPGEGSVDPAAGTFVLKTFDFPPPDGGPHVPIQLVGSNLVTAPDSGTVSLDVAIRSLYSDLLYPPAVIWLSGFVPMDVVVLNADLVIAPNDPGVDPNGNSPIGEVEYGFDYSELLGEDGVLEPWETSAAKTWSFHNPGGGSFSFASRAEFGMIPDLPRIAGFCWFDDNRNGIPEPGEQSLGFGMVTVAMPDSGMASAWVDESGRYALPVHDIGLYTLHFNPMIDTTGFVPIGFSTPNPLEVLLTPGPDGWPQSFLDANFGVFADIPPWPVIQFTDVPPDSLQVGHYQLLTAHVESPWALWAHVAFSGCGPDETFSLFMSGGFMESFPVQANLVLRKDIETECDAFWDTEKRFDLGPLVERFLDSYGPGVLLLNLHDFHGEVHQLELAIYPPDDEGGGSAGVD